MLGSAPAYHWHIEICPRTSIPTGFELGSGLFVNTICPEDAAEKLRNVLFFEAGTDSTFFSQSEQEEETWVNSAREIWCGTIRSAWAGSRKFDGPDCIVYFPRLDRQERSAEEELQALTEAERTAYEMVMLAAFEVSRKEMPRISSGLPVAGRRDDPEARGRRNWRQRACLSKLFSIRSSWCATGCA